MHSHARATRAPPPACPLIQNQWDHLPQPNRRRLMCVVSQMLEQHLSAQSKPEVHHDSSD